MENIPTKLVRPISNQTRRTSNDTLLNCGFASVRGLLEKGPHEGNTLKGFPETHLVGHDAAVLVLYDHPRRTPIEKL